MQLNEQNLGKPIKKIKQEDDYTSNFTQVQKQILNKYLDSLKEYSKIASILIQHQQNSFKTLNQEVKGLFEEFGQNQRINKCIQCCKQNSIFLQKIIKVLRSHVNGEQTKKKIPFKQNDFQCQRKTLKSCDFNNLHIHSHQFQISPSLVFSILIQVCRQWSPKYQKQRNYILYIKNQVQKHLNQNINNSKINILVLGSGMGIILKQISELVSNLPNQYSVQGHEQEPEYYLISQYFLNYSRQKSCIYPNIHNFSNLINFKIPYQKVQIQSYDCNSRKYLPITFGDFQSLYKSHTNQWNILITTFFNYSIKDILKYIQILYKILKKGGLWLDVSCSCFDKNIIGMSYKQYENILNKSMFKLKDKFQRQEKWYYNQNILMNEYRKVYYRIMKKEQ